MALSIIEINYLISGKVTPLETSTTELLNTVILRHVNYLYNNEKEVPESDILATSYQQKERALRARVNNRESNVFSNFLTKIFLKIGDMPEITMNHFRVGTIEYWTGILMDNIPATFDDIAGITTAERNAYNAVE